MAKTYIYDSDRQKYQSCILMKTKPALRSTVVLLVLLSRYLNVQCLGFNVCQMLNLFLPEELCFTFAFNYFRFLSFCFCHPIFHSFKLFSFSSPFFYSCHLLLSFASFRRRGVCSQDFLIEGFKFTPQNLLKLLICYNCFLGFLGNIKMFPGVFHTLFP